MANVFVCGIVGSFNRCHLFDGQHDVAYAIGVLYGVLDVIPDVVSGGFENGIVEAIQIL